MGTKADRSGVIITTIVGGVEQAYVIMNRDQLAAFIDNLQMHLGELK